MLRTAKQEADGGAAQQVDAPAAQPSREELVSQAIETMKSGVADTNEAEPDDIEEFEAEGAAAEKPKPARKAARSQASGPVEGEPAADEPQLDTPAQKKAWAAVLERENTLRTEREAAKREREELLSMRDKMSSQIEEVRSREERFREELRKDPLGVLKREAGIDYDTLTARVIGDDRPDPIRAVETVKKEASSEIATLKEEIKRLSDRLEEGEREKYRSDYRGGIKRALESDDYSMLRAKANAEELVFDLAARYAAEHGELLTAEDAAARIQDEFREELARLVKVESVASYLRELASGDAERTERRPQRQVIAPARRGVSTIQRDEHPSSRASGAIRPIDGRMTREEAIAEAIKRVRG